MQSDIQPAIQILVKLFECKQKVEQASRLLMARKADSPSHQQAGRLLYAAA